MDITCATCGEPWDHYHMRHDEFYEWDLTDEEERQMKDKGVITDSIRAKAKAAGWEFAGNYTMAILRCPCCEDNESHNGILHDMVERKERTQQLAELLDGDPDALTSTLSEFS